VSFAVWVTYLVALLLVVVLVVERRRGCWLDFSVVNVASVEEKSFGVAADVVIVLLAVFTSLLFTTLRSVMPN
jgi:hypothetical protein